MPIAAGKCKNFNHGRTNVSIRYCPSCGEIVNARVSKKVCKREEHERRRKEKDRYCLDCGMQLD